MRYNNSGKRQLIVPMSWEQAECVYFFVLKMRKKVIACVFEGAVYTEYREKYKAKNR
ncbi:hypothetical protein ABQD81_00905 [Enterococcus casseliflavus]